MVYGQYEGVPASYTGRHNTLYANSKEHPVDCEPRPVHGSGPGVNHARADLFVPKQFFKCELQMKFNGGQWTSQAPISRFGRFFPVVPSPPLMGQPPTQAVTDIGLQVAISSTVGGVRVCAAGARLKSIFKAFQSFLPCSSKKNSDISYCFT